TFLTLNTSFTITWDGEYCHIDNRSLKIEETLEIHIQGDPMSFYIMSFDDRQAVYDTSSVKSLTFGKNDYDDIKIAQITIDFVLIRANRQSNFTLYRYECELFCNFKSINKKHSLKMGDQIFFEGINMVIGNDEVQITTSSPITTTLIPLNKSQSIFD